MYLTRVKRTVKDYNFSVCKVCLQYHRQQSPILIHFKINLLLSQDQRDIRGRLALLAYFSAGKFVPHPQNTQKLCKDSFKIHDRCPKMGKSKSETKAAHSERAENSQVSVQRCAEPVRGAVVFSSFLPPTGADLRD